MSTKTLTLTDFLLARIAEDERAARRTLEHEADLRAMRAIEVEYRWVMLYGGGSHGFHRGAPDPARVLAECEAKRRIVKWVNDWPLRPSRPSSVDGVLEIFAAVYADHPDYREEWRP